MADRLGQDQVVFSKLIKLSKLIKHPVSHEMSHEMSAMLATLTFSFGPEADKVCISAPRHAEVQRLSHGGEIPDGTRPHLDEFVKNT